MNKDAKIYVAGHRGMVGAAIVRSLEKAGFNNFVLRTRSELDLTNQSAANEFFEMEKPDYVFLAAARVGGIHANDIYPADFIRDNLQIRTNIIDAAYRQGTKKLLFLGATCIYPKMALQPIKEEYLLTGPLEQTNEWYAIAEIVGLIMCVSYRRQYAFDAYLCCQQICMGLDIILAWRILMFYQRGYGVFMRQKLSMMNA